MDEILKATRDLYDREARAYVVATGSYDLFPGLKEELDRFYARVITTRPLLDLGCGIGRDTEYLISRGSAVVAADLSMEMLLATRQRCRLASASLVQAAMPRLPFKDGVFGGAWVCASLLHMPKSKFSPTLAEIFRVLTPGGVVAISMKAGAGEGWRAGCTVTAPRWFTLVDPEEFAQMVQSAGFALAKSIPSGRKNWFITEAWKPAPRNSTTTDYN